MNQSSATRNDQSEPPKRLTLSAIVEQLLQRGSSEHSAVTLSRNSKGETQIEVVVRTGDTGTVTTVEEAEAAAISVYDRLRGRYPMSNGQVAP